MPWAAVGAVGGALISSKASSKAAESQSRAAQGAAAMDARATEQAIEEQQRQFDLARSDLQPWRETGVNALGRLSQMTGLPAYNAEANKTYTAADLTGDYLTRYQAFQRELNGVNPLIQGIGNERMRDIPGLTARKQAAELGIDKLFNEFSAAQKASQPQTPVSTEPYVFSSDDPSYAFRQSEGNRAIDAALRARGMYGSGGALKELTRYNSDLASTEFGNQFGRLSTLAGYGSNATSQGNQLGANYATNTGNLLTSGANNQGNALLAGANARASGYTGSADAWGGALGTAGSTLADWWKKRG